MVIITKRCVISGHVQGVSYRASAYQKAREIGVGGWVKNLSNGTVECLIQGNKDQIAKMVRWLQTGPALSKVTGVQCYDEKPADLDGFRVTR